MLKHQSKSLGHPTAEDMVESDTRIVPSMIKQIVNAFLHQFKYLKEEWENEANDKFGGCSF